MRNVINLNENWAFIQQRRLRRQSSHLEMEKSM